MREMLLDPRRAAERRCGGGLAHQRLPSSPSAPARRLVAGMAVEGAGRRELAQFVADHVLGHQHRNEFVAVIDAKGQADELREDRRPPRPRPDHLVAPRTARLLRLFQQIAVDERTFPYRACHALPPSIWSVGGGAE